MKKIAIYFFLLGFSAHLLSQTDESIFSFNYGKKQIAFGYTIPEFQKLFPNSKLFDEFQERNLQVYLPSKSKYDFKSYFYLNRLVAIELSCVSEQCYQSASAFELIGKQIKKQLNLIHEGKAKNTTFKFYHSPGYIGFDELYVGSETGDPAFTFKLIDLNYLSKFSDQINLNYLFEMSNILYSKGYKSDYEKIAGILEKNALIKLDENPEDLQSYYNPYRVLLEIYEKLKNYNDLLYVWKKLRKYFPNDPNVKKNIEKYQAIVGEDEVLKDYDNFKKSHVDSQQDLENYLFEEYSQINGISEIQELDLNDDNTPEFVVKTDDLYLWIFQQSAENYKPILQNAYSHGNDPEALKSKSNGFRDLKISWGFHNVFTDVYYEFNGLEYEEIPSFDKPLHK